MAAPHKAPYYWGVSGLLPYDTDHEALAAGKAECAAMYYPDFGVQPGEEAPGGGDIVALDALPEDSETESEKDVETSAIERLKKDAVSIPHLLAHCPKNSYCPTCNWAKTIRKQQRRLRHKGI